MEEKKKLFGREIRPDDFIVENPDGDDFIWMEDLIDGAGGWNVVLTARCNVDEVFGTHVATSENGDYINVYANLTPFLTEATPALDVTLCKEDGTDEYFERPLNEDEQRAILYTLQSALPKLVNELINQTQKSILLANDQKLKEREAKKC